MKKGKQLGILFTTLFVLGCLLSGLFLIQLRAELAVEAGVLSAGEIDMAQPYLLKVQLAVFTTFILGLVGYYVIQRTDSHEVIYVDRRKDNALDDQSESDKKQEKARMDMPIAFTGKRKADAETLFLALCKEIEAVTGAFYELKGNGKGKKLELTVPFALSFQDASRPSFEIGEGLVGQSAREMKPLFIEDIPPSAIRARSGLGESHPTFLAVLPVINQDKVLGVCEIGTFGTLTQDRRYWLEEICRLFGEKISVKSEPKKVKQTES